jgi:signal transduction histidine kinase
VPEPTDVAELSLEVVKELRPQILTKKLKIQENYDKNLTKIKADPGLLRIVLQNLISNAVKYTPHKGTVEIDVMFAKDAKLKKPKTKEGDILIKVKDDGYGIPKKQHSKIFSKLFRADNIKQLDTQGTGLGLYIVKSILDNSGCQIWFESEENKGSTFYVFIPKEGMTKKEGAKQLRMSKQAK